MTTRKDSLAARLGRRGGLARRARLSAEERRAIAQRAGRASAAKRRAREMARIATDLACTLPPTTPEPPTTP